MNQNLSKTELQTLANQLQGQLPNLKAIEVAQCIKSFKWFVRSAWHVISPERAFVDGFHIDAICDHLQACKEGKIRRLIIGVPPRFSKSTITSVCFAVWVWLTDPSKQFILITHSLDLGIRDNVLARDLIRSKWFQDMFPWVELKSDVDTKERYDNTRGGSRSVYPVRSTTVTGQNADYIILDDPNYADQNEEQRVLATDWYISTCPSRFNDPTTGVTILIQQRLAVSDFTGFLLEQGGWDHLCLPMEFETEGANRVTSIGFKDPRTEGELLCPARFPPEIVERIKKDQPKAWPSQYQMRPVLAGGELIQTGKFKTWYKSTLPDFDEVVLSADLSFAGAKTSDWCVIQAWGRSNLDCFLLEQVRGRWDFPQQLAQFEGMCTKYPSSVRLVEKAANGFALIQSLTNKISRLIPVIPKGSKVNRVQSITPMIDSGHVFIPDRSNPQISIFLLEASQFPRDKHDDCVDAMSQALQRFDTSTRTKVTYGQHQIWG